MYAPYPLCAEAERLASGVGEILVSILDRLLHHATVINIKGNSYRMRRHANALDPSKERPLL